MRSILLILLFSLSVGIFGQDSTDSLTLVRPSEGKCMVYIARRSSTGFLIKFSIYDGDIFLGKLGANKYFAYECDPGEHVFIAKSENTSYVEAHLEAGKTYVMDAEVKMGIAVARVSLTPLDKTHKKYEKEKKKYLEFVAKKKGELLIDGKENNSEEQEADTENIAQGDRMKKFYEMKEKGKKITTITSDMFI